MKIKPSAGIKVRHPDTKRHLKDEGEIVTSNLVYWRRQINRGDVVEITEDKPAAPAKKGAK